MRGHGITGTATRRLVALCAAILVGALAAGPAAAQSISGASASTGGSTGDSGNGDGSNRASVAISNDGSTLATRFAWNVSADTTVASTRQQNANAQHNISFNVTAPGAYRLDVSQSRVGIIQRNSDVSGCDGSADTSGISGSQTGASSVTGSLSIGDPGSVGNGGGDSSVPFSQSASASLFATSNGSPHGHSLTFTWNGFARSNSCEAAVRQGEGTSVSGCGACEYPGSPGRTQGDDGHFVSISLVNFCGNGSIDSSVGEQCDTGILGSVCCTSSCHFASSSVQCRAAADVCDVAENCTGSSATCPANAFQPSSQVCRSAAGVCDVAENCTGGSAPCPPDQFAPSSTVCRPQNGVCDVAEHCTGTIAVCPNDGFASSATVCRGAAGVCDVAENCTGAGPNCPADSFAPSSTVCRGSGGPCDIAEHCTGSGASCPADAKSTAVCRAPATVCDAPESCDGVSDDCPFDLVQPSTVQCRGATGVCDVAENCDGVTTVCPPDGKSTAECRAANGDCDVADSCDGVSNDCPADAFKSAGIECRAVAGPCDVAETCTGSGPNCPADAFAPATTVCRPDAGDCDVAETCTGSGADCPADGFEPDGTSCSDGNQCTLSDMCVDGACVGDSQLCGDGVLQSGCNEECDDGNLDAGDGCSPTCQIEPGLACESAPLTGCRRPFVSGKAQIQLAKKGGVKDFLKWKWLKGDRTTFAEYGNPLTTTSYQACVYDQTGLRMEITIPAGGTCAGKPCWKQTGFTGYQYKDKDLTPDGAQKLKLKEGGLGKAKIQLLGRGPNLHMPDPATLMQPVTVQLQDSNGLCWEAIYSSPPTTQSSALFKDKAD